MSNFEPSFFRHEDGTPKRIFATYFNGFDPEIDNFVGFSTMGARDSLLRESRHGDLLLAVGTSKKPTPKGYRRRMLGFQELTRSTVSVAKAARSQDEWPQLYNDKGKFKWPYAIKSSKAWRFKNLPISKDVLGRKLRMSAINQFDELNAEEIKAVEAAVNLQPVTLSPKHVDSNPTTSSQKTDRKFTGPPPSEWSRLIKKSDGPTSVYIARFGTRNCFKIGISKNVDERLKALNFSIPHELLGIKWEFFNACELKSGAEAFAIEQAFLKAFDRKHRMSNEQVHVTEKKMNDVWKRFEHGEFG